MNYYPNYYGYQSYNNNNNANQYMPQVPNYITAPPNLPNQQNPLQSLNGKIVDSADVVRATEVPIGGYGIFPKADLSEIYIKSWNNNGTTSIITFKPEEPQAQDEAQENNQTGAIITEILNKINTLEQKIDNLSIAPQTLRKEVNKANEY